MEHLEKDPSISPIGFQELDQLLDDGEGLILSRNKARYFRGDSATESFPIHYEDIAPWWYSTEPRYPGEDVTKEFSDAAKTVMSFKRVMAPMMYPKLTVINDATDQGLVATLDVAAMIADERISVYSSRARSRRGGERITLALGSVIYDLAKEAGVESQPLILDEYGASAISEIDIDVQRTFPKIAHEGEPDISPRGDSALGLLQMDVSLQAIKSVLRSSRAKDSRLELTARVGSLPDLHVHLLDMIDTIESHGWHLYYGKGDVYTEEMGSMFLLLDEHYRLLSRLSEDTSLPLAVYNAYLQVMEQFRGI